ncbi:hypothetical protein Tco_0647496 [Tanacetum coccineum]
MGIPTIGQTGELLPLPPLASIWKDLRLLEALEKFKWTVVRDHEIKVLGEVNVELESGSKKLGEKLRQEEDTEEKDFEEFSLTLDNVLEKLSQENKSTEFDWQDDPLHETEDLFVGLDQPIHLVVAQNNVHERVAEEVGESRPSKRIRVTQEEMVKDQKSKKA